MRIRIATVAEYPTARSILNAAMLTVESGLLRRSSVFVAVEEGRILGALVLRGSEIEAIAVRPGRRGQGIGTALVERALARRPVVVAGFDPAVRPFYEHLGFEVRCSGGRCRGRLTSSRGPGTRPRSRTG
jgi:GNAT superfamily N-acetyltransferase